MVFHALVWAKQNHNVPARYLIRERKNPGFSYVMETDRVDDWGTELQPGDEGMLNNPDKLADKRGEGEGDKMGWCSRSVKYPGSKKEISKKLPSLILA
jgi:hypothetical protein